MEKAKNWRRVLSMMLCAGILLCTAPKAQAAVGQASDWARADLAAAEADNLLPDGFNGADMTQPITRQEFCTVALAMYERMTGTPAPRAMNSNFTDTTDGDVNRACELGLVSGRGNGMFMPDEPMTREEMFGALYNLLKVTNHLVTLETGEAETLVAAFRDRDEIAQWAVVPIATMLKLELTSGANPGLLEPKAIPSREQAVVLALRFATQLAAEPSVQSSQPEIAAGGAIINVSRGETLPQVIGELAANTEDYQQKLMRVFGDKLAAYSESLPNYPTEEAAKADMVTITIPAWDLVGGVYVAKTYESTVQKNLAGTYQAIFNEIYQLPNRFPIHDIGCYAWRTGTSGHSSGTAIDINANENPQMRNDGTIIVGKAYEPYTNPYSLTEDGDVVRIFAKYGFAWGGNAWRSSKDYMHFTYFGI